MSTPKDNLQEITDGIRADLKKGFGGKFQINHPELKHPLVLDVTPDGVSAWLVRMKCGDRILYDTGHAMCVNPDEFLSNLYVILRSAIKAAKTPPPKPS
jgi:hypothetical protein